MENVLLYDGGELDQRTVYIVYLGGHKGNKTLYEKEEMHLSYLSYVKEAATSEVKHSLIYSYKHSINGFAASLTRDEASKLSEMEDVISVDESNPDEYSLDTTRSWEFLGLGGLKDEMTHTWNQFSIGEEMLSKAEYGKNIIVGVMDTGDNIVLMLSFLISTFTCIWPESTVFRDEGIDLINPELWRGICQTADDFDDSHCNKKVIGARYYPKNYEKKFGSIDATENTKSPRDIDGHGTLTASIVTGQKFSGAEALGGFGNGTTSGGAPMAYLAIYKVCWVLPDKPKAAGSLCYPADILAAVDQAIADGVHILSISTGAQKPSSYDADSISIAAFHAMQNNIVVVSSAGNNGPNSKTVKNAAPWIFTVGASSIDRMFPGPLMFDNGSQIMGQSVTPYELENMHPLVRAMDVENSNVVADEKGHCLDGSLSPDKLKGKIVLCKSGKGRRTEKGVEVEKAGGAGFILQYSEEMGKEDFVVDAHLLPAIALSASDAMSVLEYMDSVEYPMATIKKASTVIHNRPAPSVCSFSSRGPNIIDPYILKPDIIAPGLNILGAWSEASSPTNEFDDDRRVKFNIRSGASVAVPHVAAVSTLLKAIHPTWSSAAIKSALMTTASQRNNMGSLITDYNGHLASPFAYGSGHLRPEKAADPGLVYDISYTDYLIYLCSGGLKNINKIKKFDVNFDCPDTLIPLYNLNYPQLALPDISETITVERTVTNVGNPNSVYVFHVSAPTGFRVTASTEILEFDHLRQKKSFVIEVTPIDTAGSLLKGDYSYGSYSWIDSSHDYEVRSVIAVSSA
ncbi:subtilisin-like protease SBT5.6 [Tripterygium wilfordii]|uniref:subtilisin-like protease SBT5.6 n=1 Tax=Tripterygium wilfordii TaxID=458696 RepID=UPI0018F839F7|nr:subtilisin-like protease SBT5.6 [Tripterygium wilfordii]